MQPGLAKFSNCYQHNKFDTEGIYSFKETATSRFMSWVDRLLFCLCESKTASSSEKEGKLTGLAGDFCQMVTD